MHRGEVRADPRHVLEAHPTKEEPAEVDGPQEEEEQDRHKERELDERLTP